MTSTTVSQKIGEAGYFATFGQALLGNGYLITPIRPGHKRPAMDRWQNARLGAADLARFPGCGVGILCGQGAHPIAAIDVDTLNAELAERFVAWCQQHFGPTCERVGLAPKILLPYRAASEGWGKATGAWFEDLAGQRHRLEVLGKGQQFVAYHIHPDTGRPYEWTDVFGGLEAMQAADLPTVTEAQLSEALRVFEAMAIEAGLAQVIRSNDQLQQGTSPNNDPLMVYEPPVGLSLSQARRLAALADNEDYDAWLKVGMALHHEFDGSTEALDLWDDWSSTASNYESREDLERRWDSFGRSNRSPATARWLLKLAKDHRGQTRVAASAITLAPITGEEMARARLSPRIILSGLLYADVRTRISAGGTGKTTLALFEAVTLALGRELWGRDPGGRRRTAIITREDSRDTLVARMREIMGAMMLDDDETRLALENVLIIDLSGEAFRLSAIHDDVVLPHKGNIEALVEALASWAPDWIIFDPLVSFGVGESRVNDAEQGLIEAFRILRNRLDCCVEGIHHSGKANAREKSLDQYAGRGGSALADGARMVAVMQPLEPAEWVKETGTPLEPGETGIIMALPKLSYSPKQEAIFIRRRGYHFTMQEAQRKTPEEAAQQREEKLFQFILAEYGAGRRYSKTEIEDAREMLGMSRQHVRAAVSGLKAGGRVLYHLHNGKKGSYYEPLTLAELAGEGIPTEWEAGA